MEEHHIQQTVNILLYPGHNIFQLSTHGSGVYECQWSYHAWSECCCLLWSIYNRGSTCWHSICTWPMIAHEELLVYMKLKTVDIHVHRHSLLFSYSIATDWLPGGDPPLTSASGKSPANWCSTTDQIKSKASLMPLHAMKTIQRSVFIGLVVYVNILYCEIAKWWISFQNIKRK